ncbi:hypothetical protein ACQCN2_04210 [Brevibacillus ginsengisoli]|uniref:hypothetical protein n=1 Tax=Brevibacillus ginsengisoli TaxID=363854 RepID=UPI003CE79392
MNTRKWRNPYTPISKKVDRSVLGQANALLAITPKKEPPATDIRLSVLKMRDNIKGISSTIRQMEETMDTIYGAMEMLDSLGRKSAKPQATTTTKPNQHPHQHPHQHAEVEADEPQQSQGSGLSGALGNLDIGQLLSILQSPLVQNLLQQSNTGPLSNTEPSSNTASTNKSKRKKEG